MILKPTIGTTMTPLKEFAAVLRLNVAALADIYAEHLVESRTGYENFSMLSRQLSARKVLKGVSEAYETGDHTPFTRLFTLAASASNQRWPDEIIPPAPLAELEVLGQTLMPTIPNLEASRFLWQLLAEARMLLYKVSDEQLAPSRLPATQADETPDLTPVNGNGVKISQPFFAGTSA